MTNSEMEIEKLKFGMALLGHRRVLEVDVALMTGGVSLCHHNKVTNINIANLCVWFYRESHGIHITIFTCS